MKTLIGKDYVQDSYDKFIVIQDHVEDFTIHYYEASDYPLVELKLNFLTEADKIKIKSSEINKTLL